MGAALEPSAIALLSAGFAAIAEGRGMICRRAMGGGSAMAIAARCDRAIRGAARAQSATGSVSSTVSAVIVAGIVLAWSSGNALPTSSRRSA